MLKVLKPFIVWALYPMVLQYFGNNHLLSALICLGLVLIISYGNLRSWFVIDWATAVYFSLVVLFEFSVGKTWITAYPLLWMSGAYVIVSGLSLVLRKPFTLQYAREYTSEEYWSDWHFLRINYHLTFGWTFIFLVSFLLTAESILNDDYWPLFVIARNSLIAVGLVLPEQYPTYYLKQRGLEMT